jgi:hypothetical protein
VYASFCVVYLAVPHLTARIGTNSTQTSYMYYTQMTLHSLPIVISAPMRVITWSR